MGDGQNGNLRVGFDRQVKLTFLGSKVSSQAVARGTGCVNCARPGLWEPRAGNRPGPPGHAGAEALAQKSLNLNAGHLCRGAKINLLQTIEAGNDTSRAGTDAVHGVLG